LLRIQDCQPQSCYHQKPMNPPNPSDPEQGRAALKPADLVRTEAAALEALATRLEGPMAEAFVRAVELILRCGHENGRVVVTGMGKSGIIAQKIAATLSSTGSAALFLHPAEAVHGDVGVLLPGDVVVALSASGETEEILRLLATLKRKGDALVSFCCNLHSTLAQASDVALDCGVEREACGLNLAPTASTTTMLALGDALAIAVSLRKGFRAEDFADLHPGGKLGKRLAKVRDLMHSGDAIPVVAPATLMTDVIYEMSSKKLGMATVQEQGQLRGVISDGDLRRLLEREGGAALSRSAGEAMNANPRTIAASELAATALAILEERKITSLVVVGANQAVEGVLHLHDLWGVELI
jgi:arabinose-5-phosphate isomerase